LRGSLKRIHHRAIEILIAAPGVPGWMRKQAGQATKKELHGRGDQGGQDGQGAKDPSVESFSSGRRSRPRVIAAWTRVLAV
jgi:hypothetical protein